jgi:hypothetical protein
VILSAEQARLIQAGKKTQMRVEVVDEGTYQPTRLAGPRVEVGGSLRRVPYGPERVTKGNEPRVGQLIPINRAVTVDGKATSVRVCSFEVVDYHRALLGKSITLDAARAEGHRTTDDYRVWWVRTYDVVWLNSLLARHDTPPSEEDLRNAILVRFEDRHQFHLVWVITGRHVADAINRMLAAEPDRVESPYTTQSDLAVRYGGDALDEFEQRRESDRAREHQELRQAGAAERDLERLCGLDSEIRKLRQFGVSHGYDLRKQLQRMQQARDGIERTIRRQASEGRNAA